MSAGSSWLSLPIILLLSIFCLADHLPDNLQAKGRPERTLAGIRLGRSKVADVIKMYGEPDCLIKEERPPGYTDTYGYYWYKGDLTLILSVDHSKEPAGNEYISMIEIKGSAADGMLGRTGAGVRLGAGFSQLRRIYGRRFQLRNIPEYNIHDVMYEWQSGYSLVAELDQENRIKSLSLFAPK